MAAKTKPERRRQRFDPDAPLVAGDEGLSNLGRMFKRVVSVSNKAVQETMKAEKRKRQARRGRTRHRG